MMQRQKISRSITKSVDLRVSPERAFDFLNDLENWPKWAVVNMKSVKPATGGWYDTETRQGKGQLKMVSNKSLGLLDHVWKDPQASWTVPARVIPNGDGATFLMTFFQPPVLDDNAFDSASKEVDIELARLKEILEGES
ncbi:MAG TPA: SRPBCC family protein [Terriglobia bacterium]|nr:SRPBCC family protein [Terriglobia bacterium]